MLSLRTRRSAALAIAATMLMTTVTLGRSPQLVPAGSGLPEPDVITEWNQHAVAALVTAGQPPHVFLLHLAMVQGAVYDAVNAIDGGYEPYLSMPAAQPGASPDAAAATAAYEVLVHLLPAQQASHATLYQATLDDVADGPTEDGGVAVGHAAAAAMITDRANDGRFGGPGFPVGSDPGEWRPVLPAFVNDPNAWVADVRPFLLDRADRFRSDGPLPLDSAAYAVDFDEVKSLGSTNSSRRTADQTAAVNFWGVGHPPAMWNAMFRTIVIGQSLSTPERARVFAMLALTAADAAIACWDDKRHHGFWRPITAIREAEADGNPATVADPAWLPLLPTPPYPDHPSAHTCISGSYVYTLQDLFGTGPFGFGGTNPVNGISRDFDRFHEAIKEIIDARVWAGLHFRTADQQGAVIGKKVAHYRDLHFFTPTD